MPKRNYLTCKGGQGGRLLTNKNYRLGINTKKRTMNNGLVRYIVISSLLMVTFIFNLSESFAQEKQEIPANFFTGKWAGNIREKQEWFIVGNRLADGEYILEIFNLSVEEEGWFGQAKLSGSVRFYPEGWGAENTEKNLKIYGHFERDNTIVFHREGEDSPSLLLFGCFYNDGLKFEFDRDRILINTDENGVSFWGPVQGKVTGELYRITTQKKIFPADIKPNEPIKTDEKTQMEITLPSKDVIKVAQNTEAVIRSESLMEVVKGKIHGLIKKLKVKGKFEYHTPTVISAVLGTEFELNVEDDGTTTVVVFEGEVEFSDKENKKTVIVKKNQKSVVKRGTLPTEPEQFDPEKILKWWE